MISISDVLSVVLYLCIDLHSYEEGVIRMLWLEQHLLIVLHLQHHLEVAG